MENKSEKRLKILSNSEYKEIYEIPNFDKEDRLNFFSLDESELLLLDRFRANKAKIFFILQLGYFKYSYRFFNFSFSDCSWDCEYLIKHYFARNNLQLLADSLKTDCSQVTILKQRGLILDLFSGMDKQWPFYDVCYDFLALWQPCHIDH